MFTRLTRRNPFQVALAAIMTVPFSQLHVSAHRRTRRTPSCGATEVAPYRPFGTNPESRIPNPKSRSLTAKPLHVIPFIVGAKLEPGMHQLNIVGGYLVTEQPPGCSVMRPGH